MVEIWLQDRRLLKSNKQKQTKCDAGVYITVDSLATSFFDGHAVDWDELMSRLAAFSAEEVDALPQVHDHGEAATCGSDACAGSCAD